MKLYDAILQGNEATLENARDFVNGYVWCEVEATEQPRPTHSDIVETIGDIAIWYDYGADYYFFEQVMEELF